MIFEDQLPAGYPYDAMFPYSAVVDGVRMFPDLTPEPSAADPSATSQIRSEIHRVILRYGQESDVMVYQAIGVLVIVILDLVALLDKKDQS